jgi:hypothetical protein
MLEKSNSFNGAQELRNIANKLDAIDHCEFAGAIVIIPPTGDIKTLVLEAKSPNRNFFWAQVGALLQIAQSEIENEERQKRGYL